MLSDAVVALEDSCRRIVEVKLDESNARGEVAHLVKLAHRMDEESIPFFLMMFRDEQTLH